MNGGQVPDGQAERDMALLVATLGTSPTVEVGRLMKEEMSRTAERLVELNARIAARNAETAAIEARTAEIVAARQAVPVKPTLPKHVMKLALGIYKRMTAHYRAYLDSCEQDRRNGHTPRYCEHGTNRWTDFDNICGGCEDGVSLRDRLSRWQMAKEQASERHTDAKAMLVWAMEARKHGMDTAAFVAASMARYEQMMEV